MGASCSRDRMRCLMIAEALISVVLFAASMYMFFMVGYFTSTNRRILSLIFGVLGGLILVGGVMTTTYAATIWRDMRKDDDVQTVSPERKVRFSSLVEVHEGTQPKPDAEVIAQFDHEYEEICPPTPGRKPPPKDNNPGAKLNCKEENSEIYPCPHPIPLPVADKETLPDKDLLREAYKAYLEHASSYGTFKGNYQSYPQRDVKGLENEEEEEIII